MKCAVHLCLHCCCPAKPDKAMVWGQGESRCCLAEIKGKSHLCITNHCRTTQTPSISISMQKPVVWWNRKNKSKICARIHDKYKKGPNPSSCTPSLWEGPPEPLWSAPLHRSLELSNFALMFATGSGSWMPARPVTSQPRRSSAQRDGNPEGSACPLLLPPAFQNSPYLQQDQWVPRSLPPR